MTKQPNHSVHTAYKIFGNGYDDDRDGTVDEAEYEGESRWNPFDNGQLKELPRLAFLYPQKDSTPKWMLIKNSEGKITAAFSSQGDICLKGHVKTDMNGVTSPLENGNIKDWIICDMNSENPPQCRPLMWIEINSGNMYINGTIEENNSDDITPSGSDKEFIIKSGEIHLNLPHFGS